MSLAIAAGDLEQAQALYIPAREFISIVGASGCGKSTLLRLILGLDEEYEGRILLNGQPIDGTGLERGRWWCQRSL